MRIARPSNTPANSYRSALASSVSPAIRADVLWHRVAQAVFIRAA
jgi:hypothetical protein